MKKNVMLLINQLYGGGAQKVIANLSIYLSENYNVTFVIYNDIEKVVFPYAGELVKISLPYAADTHNTNFFQRSLRFLSLVRQVRKLKKQRKIDVCISFMEASNIVNVLSRREEKIVISVRSYLTHEFKDHPRLQIFRHFVRVLYNKAQHIAVPSLLLQHDLMMNFHVKKDNLSLVYNFVDQELVGRLKTEPLPSYMTDIFNRFRVIVNVGRVTNPKAQWLLMPVLAKVLKVHPGTKLVILGEGPKEEKLMQAAEQCGIKVYRHQRDSPEKMDEFDVFLMGFTKNPFPYLNRGTLFIKSSVYEGFPNVIIEAMTTGLPVISTDCSSGPREIIEPSSDFLKSTREVEFAEYGVLTPAVSDDIAEPQYVQSAAEAIVNLLDNPELLSNYRKQSTERAADFEKKKILAQWIKLIEQ